MGVLYTGYTVGFLEQQMCEDVRAGAFRIPSKCGRTCPKIDKRYAKLQN